MFNRQELKSRAKAVMARSYMTLFIACLAINLLGGGGVGMNLQKLQRINTETMSDLRVLLISGIVGILIIIGVLFFHLIVSPAYVGLKKFILNTTKGPSSLEDLLYPFKSNYKNIAFTMFMKNLYIFLWSLPSFVPFLVGIYGFGMFDKIAELIPQIKADSISAALQLMTISTTLLLTTFIFSIPSIIKDLQYSMVQYILADDPDMNWKSAIAKSKEMMVGNKWAFVKLLFSFTGWYIICNFTCCIGGFLLSPYIETTVAQMYIEISGQRADYDNYEYNNSTNFFQNFRNM